MEKSNASQVDFLYIFYSLKSFDYVTSIKWGNRYWTTCFIYVVIYLLLINIGQRWMRNRKPYELRLPLFLWNSTLAVFSFVGAYKFIAHIHEVWTNYGFQATVCLGPLLSSDKANLNVFGYWGWLFGLSKVVELGDTAFIVLRKQKLVFLHWYHHVTVLIFTWFSMRQLAATGRWFIAVNYSVHTAMYAYFALRAVKVKVPRTVAMAITFGQMMQMVVGLYVNWRAYYALAQKDECDVGYNNIASSLVMYASYWVLFAHLFYASYLKKDSKRKSD